ncbi:hypothetical protein JXO59_14040 [candidate division KSB1 bacterium]|nr:hypothetical protein [candidate division KSB1 bacterium]
MPIADTSNVLSPPSGTADSLYWFTINETISIVALTMGVLIFIIAYFAGGRDNRNKLIISTILSVIITSFALPLFLKLGRWLGLLESREGTIFILVLILLFLAALSCHIYEIVTVSAREARPPE